MLLRHATLLCNLPSVQRRGLLCSKSQGKKPVVWLHASSKTPWAMLHTVKRHGGKIEAVVIVEATVPRSWLRRSKRGLWYCVRDIPAGRFGRIIGFGELATSPVDDNRLAG
jgi:hypothetical protein